MPWEVNTRAATIYKDKSSHDSTIQCINLRHTSLKELVISFKHFTDLRGGLKQIHVEFSSCSLTLNKNLYTALCKFINRKAIHTSQFSQKNMPAKLTIMLTPQIGQLSNTCYCLHLLDLLHTVIRKHYAKTVTIEAFPSTFRYKIWAAIFTGKYSSDYAIRRTRSYHPIPTLKAHCLYTLANKQVALQGLEYMVNAVKP